MRLSELLATVPPGTDPEIIILRDWGTLSPAIMLDPADLADGDPVIDALARSGDAIILQAEPEA